MVLDYDVSEARVLLLEALEAVERLMLLSLVLELTLILVLLLELLLVT